MKGAGEEGDHSDDDDDDYNHHDHHHHVMIDIKELLEKLPAAKEGKILADKMIDNCGNPPGNHHLNS